MKTKKNELLSKVYDRNIESHAFIIKTLISKYTDIFNDLDPSPLRKRDLDQDFINYLVDCSLDIPLRHKIELHLICPKEIADMAMEERAKAGISTYCNLTMLTLREELKKSYKKAVGYIAIFIVLVSIAFAFGPTFEKHVILETLREGIFIGGWVFLWEAIAIIFLTNKKTISEYKKFERLEDARVEFLYE